MDRRGSIYAWLAVLAGLVVLGFAYNIFYYMYIQVDYTFNESYKIMNISKPQEAVDLTNKTHTIFYYIIILLFGSLILYGIAYTLSKKEAGLPI